MPQIIATYRPFDFDKGISYVNSITRNKQRAPYDHVCYLENGVIYESVVKRGVRKIDFEEWKKGREGTHLFMYDVPLHMFNINVFEKLEHKQYDVPSNFWHLFNFKKLLNYKPYELINCAELLGLMNFRNQLVGEIVSEYTPRKWVEIMDDENRLLRHKII